MNLSQMIDAINRRVDDVVDTNDAVEWLNSGKNQMAMAVGATFPDLIATDLSSSFSFDSIYHEAPVLYAAARYKEQDSSLNEAQNFMFQFESMKTNFVKNYRVKISEREDYTTQQFTATANQSVFIITSDGYDYRYGDLKVYINDIRTFEFSKQDNTFTLLTPVPLGTKVTAIWEEHADLIDPPYNWWGTW